MAAKQSSCAAWSSSCRRCAPGAGEVRLLLLQVVMASGTPFSVEVARVQGG